MTGLQVLWDAAVEACLTGHENCSYGGMTPGTGYWLADEACDRKDSSDCAWCDAEAETGFVGWAPDGVSIYGVPACQPCADRWVAEHPEWKRRNPDAEVDRKTMDELLAEARTEREQILAATDPITREIWLATEKAEENILLWGNPDGPPEGTETGPLFTGIESIFGLDKAAKVVHHRSSKPLGPARQRYNPATKKWEADRG